jgi:hypothetical protein
MVGDFEAKIAEINDWLKAKGVPDLLADYARSKEEARLDFDEIAAELGIRSPWSDDEYPTPIKLAAAFRVSHAWISFEVPANLPEDIRQQETAKMEAKFNAAEQEITTALREMFGAMLKHATERLTPGPDGQEKIFKASLISNFDEFFKTFNARNLTNDWELSNLVTQARSIMSGITPNVLRNSQGMRQAVAEKLGTIKDTIDQLIIDRPSRRFDWNEE